MKNKIILLFLLSYFLIICEKSIAQCLLDKSNYELIWNDEFKYPNNDINLLNYKWLPYYTWQTPGNTTIVGEDINDECLRYFWDSSNLSLHTDLNGEGYLTIKSKKLNPEPEIGGLTYPYSSGMILSKFEDCGGTLWNPYGFHYGMFEIRCKIAPPGAGQSAIWLAGGGYEIDLFEAYKVEGNKWSFFSSVHKPLLDTTDLDYCTVYHDWLFSDPSENFHTYTLVWIKDKATFFIDGMEVRTSTLKPYSNNNCSFQQMALIASVHPLCFTTYGYNAQTGDATGGMVIDYIRVYRPKNYPGMPLPTEYQFPDYKSEETFNNINVSILTDQDVDAHGTIAEYTQLKIGDNERLYYAKSDGNISYFDYDQPSNTWKHENTGITNCGSGTPLVSDLQNNNIFYRGSDNEIWAYGFWGSGLGSSSSLDIYNLYPNDVSTNSRLAFVDYPYPRVYFKNSSNKLCYYEFKFSTSPQWIRHTTNIQFNSNEMVSNQSSNGIYYIGNDNEIWTYYVEGTNTINISMDMFNFYPNDVLRDIIASGNRIYYINNSNSVSYFEFVDSTLHWQKFSTPLVNVKSRIAPRNNNQGFFFISTDNDIYSYHFYNGVWVYNKVNFLLSDQKTFDYLKKSLINEDRIYYIDFDKELRYWEWGDCEVLNPLCASRQQIGLKGANINSTDIIYDRTEIDDGTTNILKSDETKNDLDKQLKLYPNPFTNFITIEVPTYLKGTKKNFIIYDTLGKEVLKHEVIEDELRLDVSHLEGGIYFYIVTNSDSERIQNGKIVKL